ncbi:hypothetical protein EV702DRAFT_1199355 [Suillus placidus]|uniref:Uncharacterized protein n=1 Tax=Suillus placidus TaxID=48579 RepID=A0A9P6ZS85_9AGAM|nr:hypothetical protein EV702DRAFT_1199355 [Suillus placidus]
MAPPRWTSVEQLTWLQNEVPSYLQMQKDKKLVQFFELLYPKWFSEFLEHMSVWPIGSENSPDDNDTNIDQSSLDSDAAVNEIIAELDHENVIIPISDVEKQSDLDPELAKVLKDTIKHRRKVKPLVLEDIRENKLALPDQRLHAVQHHTSECFAKELEDVKDEVHIETQHINTDRKLGSVAAGDDQTKEEIYRAIQELPIVLGQIFKELSTLTGGWHYSLVMGGPDPLCEGDIMTLRHVVFLTYHHGKTPDGLSFKASTPNFHKHHLLPFKKHLDRIYGGSSKGTSVPTSIPSTPLSTTDLVLTSGCSSPPFFATDLTLPGDLLDQQHASNVGLPLPQRPAHFEDIGFNTTPQLNGWQDSPITAWRKEFVSGENLTMSTALPQAQEPFTLPQFSFPDNNNLLPTCDLSLTGTTPPLHLHQPSPVVFSTQPSPPLSLPLLSLLLPPPEPSLPLATPEPFLLLTTPRPSLPLTTPGPSLPLATPRPSLLLASPEPSLPLTLLKPSLLLPPPEPSMPLA